MLRSVSDYLASIPNGIDSYPECLHKGEPLGVWLDQSPTAGLSERVPPPAAQLLRTRGGMPAWVPEVHATVLFLAIREAHFPDDAAFLAHALQRNRAVLDTPANRILFWVASPKSIFRAGTARWGALHRGSTIELRTPDAHTVALTMTFPPHLLPEIVVRGTGTGFKSALENAGARDVVLNLRVMEATRAVFDAKWD